MSGNFVISKQEKIQYPFRRFVFYIFLVEEEKKKLFIHLTLKIIPLTRYYMAIAFNSMNIFVNFISIQKFD